MVKCFGKVVLNVDTMNKTIKELINQTNKQSKFVFDKVRDTGELYVPKQTRTPDTCTPIYRTEKMYMYDIVNNIVIMKQFHSYSKKHMALRRITADCCASDIVRRPCCDFRRVTAPHKMSYY